MSIASEITRLQGAKADIKTAIEAKGITVPSATSIDEYDGYVARIPIAKLPVGYTEVQYVRTNSQAYIDTGIAGGSDLSIHIAFAYRTYVQYAALYGNYVDENHCCNRAILYSSSSIMVAGGNNLSQEVSGIRARFISFMDITSSNASVNLVDTSISSASLTANNTNICLGNRNSTSPVDRDISLWIFHFSIKRNDTLVLDFIPCVRDSDSKAGFYDMVTDTFKPSDTATNFVAGTMVI